MTGRAIGAAARTQLHEAALAGGASLFGTGIHPGHTDYLAAVASGMSAEVNYVGCSSIDLSLWAATPIRMNSVGGDRRVTRPREDIEKATAVDIDSLDVLAVLFGFELTDIRCEVEFAVAGADLDIPGRPIRAGHVAGIDIRWIGIGRR